MTYTTKRHSRADSETVWGISQNSEKNKSPLFEKKSRDIK